MADDEFVFKPAVLNNNNNSSSSNSKDKSSDSVELEYKTSNSPIIAASNNNSNITNNTIPLSHNPPLKYSELDSFIAERKRQMDAELSKLAHDRLAQFLRNEKEADRKRDEEFASMASSPKTSASPVLTEELRMETLEKKAAELDEKEAELFKEMKAKAKETWKELEQEYKTTTLHQLHLEQSARLAQESQLQESLKASGAIFNRQLFEKVVEKCGKGRGTVYAKEKMARFWEVLDRTYPEESDGDSKDKPDSDKLLASLLGLNT